MTLEAGQVKGNSEHYSKRITLIASIKRDASIINAVRDAAVRKCERSVRAYACPLSIICSLVWSINSLSKVFIYIHRSL